MLKCFSCSSNSTTQCNSCDGKLFCKPCSHSHIDYHFSQKSECFFGNINIRLSSEKKQLLKEKIDESIKNIKTQKKNIKSEAISIIKHIETIVKDSITTLDFFHKKYTNFYKLPGLEENDISLYEEIIKSPYCIQPSILTEYQEALSQKTALNRISNIKEVNKINTDKEYLIKFTGKNSLARNLVMANDKEFIVYVLYNTCIISSLNDKQYDSTIAQNCEIKDFVLSKDNKYIVLGLGCGYTTVLDLHKNGYGFMFKGHDNDVVSVAISIDNQYVVTGSKDKTVKVWDFINKIEKASFQENTSQVVAVEITCDKNFVVSSYNDNKVRLWNIKEKSLEGVFDNQPVYADCAIITYFTGFPYDSSGNWRILYRKSEHGFKDKNNLVICFTLTTDKKFLVSGHTDCTMRIWNLKTLKNEIIIYKTIKMTCIGITDNNNYIVSGWNDSKIRVWNILLNKEQEVFQENYGVPLQLKITNPNEITVSSSEALISWNFIEKILISKTYKSFVHAYSKCGRLCITHKSNNPKILEVWDSVDKRQLFDIDGFNAIPIYVNITDENKLAVIVTDNNTVIIWDFYSKCKINEYHGYTSYPLSILVSNDSNILVLGSNNSIVRIVFLLNKGTQDILFTGHTKCVNSVLLTRDNNFVLSGSSDKTIRMWNLRKKICEMVFEGHDDGVNCIALSDDNKTFISGSDDKTIRLWNLKLKKCISVIQGHTKITSIGISSDGCFLAYKFSDYIIEIRNLFKNNGNMILDGIANSNNFEITGDNRFLVYQDKSENLSVWNLQERSLEILISKPCNCYFKAFVCKDMDKVNITTGFGVMELNIEEKTLNFPLLFDDKFEEVLNNPQLCKTLLPKIIYPCG
ncbi:hypothetical protein SteCoe_2594 [Stentor coeruleus]|uniref:Uncharacterized protein n=1 Tax=Stentor coeruleus TaxID=5963 RepID=A0A1R2CZ38_9CILI|nr:hypothetical protein SteCoe_2594 [Stentor coeruleus]